MLNADPIWKHFVNGKSFEDFVASYPPFVYHEKVPTEIRQHLDDIHALLIHSFYRYRFLDIANARAMQVIEMALRVRHKELGSPELPSRRRKRKGSTPQLEDLLDWAEGAGLLEETDDRPTWRGWNKKRTDVLRGLRNYVIHADASTVHGVTIVGMLYSVVDFVNELYADVDVRKTRHQFEKKLQSELGRVLSGGAILEIGTIRLIVFHAEVLYAVPDGEDWDIYLGVLTIFPPSPDIDGNHELPKPLYLRLRGYKLADSVMRLTSNEGDLIRLSPITGAKNEEKFQTFWSEYLRHPSLVPAVFQPLADRRIQLKRHR